MKSVFSAEAVVKVILNQVIDRKSLITMRLLLALTNLSRGAVVGFTGREGLSIASRWTEGWVNFDWKATGKTLATSDCENKRG